jgi:hypothetical protein
MKLEKANRQQTRMKLALQGPSGSGKTYSALLLAYGLVGNWEEIAVVDTENSSSHLYCHLGQYDVLSLSKPFTPERFIEAIDFCEKAGESVIVIDSLSPEWSGEGGVLDVHGNLPGNSFTNWAKLTSRHNALVQRMLQSSSHIVATLRTKQDYILQDKGGKLVPEKVGLAAVQRDDLSYEFTLMFDLDQKHFAVASKDRTNLYSNKPQFLITEETGKVIKEWCDNGIKVSDIEVQIDQCASLDDLRQILIKYPEFKERIKSAVYRRKAQIETLASVVTT